MASRRRLLLILIVLSTAIAAIAVVPRIPLVAGYRDLGVVHAAPADVPIGIEPNLAVSRSASETVAIWAGFNATLWEQPRPHGGPPEVHYEPEFLVLATVFGSSSCAPSFGGVSFQDGVATIRVDSAFGLGGCTADAAPYTFVLAIARDRVRGEPPDIRMIPTPRAGGS